MGLSDWPEGCINFAVNLVRPVQEGHRRKALYSVLSQTLVFDTLENASSYREFVTQVMCCACASSALDDSVISKEATHQSACYAWCQCDTSTALTQPPLAQSCFICTEDGTSCVLAQDRSRSPTQSIDHSGVWKGRTGSVRSDPRRDTAED